MARVSSVRDLENCLDSAPVKEIVLDGVVDEALMRSLAVDGKLQYFPHFPKPYFRIDKADSWTIQGVFGNTTLRVTLTTAVDDEGFERLLCRIR